MFGDNTSPFENTFSVLRLNWDKVNINQFMSDTALQSTDKPSTTVDLV